MTTQPKKRLTKAEKLAIAEQEEDARRAERRAKLGHLKGRENELENRRLKIAHTVEHEKRKNQPLRALREIHREVIRRLIVGQKPKEIASDLKISTGLITRVRNSPVGLRALDNATKKADNEAFDVMKRVERLQPMALKALEEIVSDVDIAASVRLNAAKDILDRSGAAVPKQVNVAHAHLSGDDIMALKERAKAEAMRRNLVIDIEPSGEKK